MSKIIRVASCSECPYDGQCLAWQDLTSKQRVSLMLSHEITDNMILDACHLEEENADQEDIDKQN